jgi:pimeloyl-ACP methyl ester carboxylesterase
MRNETSANEVNEANSTTPRKRRGCLFYVTRGLMSIVVIVVALVLLGVVYQAAAVELDKQNYAPLGELYTVDGHQIHMNCAGEGSPTVVLQAGGVAESLWWYRVLDLVADHTRVCAYDRPGMGWSEPVSGSRDALTIVGELHTLLEVAGESAPFVMVGHSYGAVWTRIYAAQYPDEVAGIVLVDSAVLLPDHFDSQSEFDQWKSQWDSLHTITSALTQVGVTRLLGSSPFQNAGYPSEIASEMVALQARNQVIDTNFAEVVTAYWALTDAAADAESFRDLPVAVLWASVTVDSFDGNIAGFAAAREEMTTYSTNLVTRIVEGADHLSIIGNEQYALQVTDAILAVIESAQTGELLTP